MPVSKELSIARGSIAKVRFWLSGPRVLGIRPGISFRPDELLQKPSPQRQAKGGFIYVIRNDHGFLKIGVSNDPIARLAQLRTGSAVPLAIEYAGALRCDGYAIEAAVHETLASYRLQGEWFTCPADMAVAAIGAAAHHLGEPIASVDPKIIGGVVSEVTRQNQLESTAGTDTYTRVMMWLFKGLFYSALCLVLFIAWLVVMIVTGVIK